MEIQLAQFQSLLLDIGEMKGSQKAILDQLSRLATDINNRQTEYQRLSDKAQTEHQREFDKHCLQDDNRHAKIDATLDKFNQVLWTCTGILLALQAAVVVYTAW